MARELGIPFSDIMVRAMLAGHKTQTRRLKDTYRVGDVLYIREAWRAHEGLDGVAMFRRKADNSADFWPETIHNEYPRVFQRWGEGWRPARFMFKALARPERWQVVERREERLQDISEADAKAEGSWTRPGFRDVWEDAYRYAFHQAWDEINGEGSWDQNPTVYAYTLRRVVA